MMTDLLSILPQLYKDLLNSKVDTLEKYHVPWTHVNMEAHIPTTDLEKYMMKAFCVAAADGIKLQCAREYWGDSNLKARTTEIFKLTKDELKSLPTENLETERYLAKFGYLAARCAAKSNIFFKAEVLRNDLMFETHKQVADLERENLKVLKQLKQMEITWTKDQHDQLTKKIKSNLVKQRKTNDYGEAVLSKCKAHGGPFTSANELKASQKSKPEDIQKHLRYEIVFKRQLNGQDFQCRPSLYKVNGMKVEEMVANLTVLLSNEEVDSPCNDISLPSHDEMWKIIQEKTDLPEMQIFTYHQPLAVRWDETGDSQVWYLGFYLSGTMDTELQVDHLIPENRGKREFWKRPNTDDIQSVSVHQIVPVTIDGDWVQSPFSRHLQFQVKNWAEVDQKMASFF